MVWDTIYDRDPAQRAVEEWGGISYSLAALDATLAPDWEIVPLVKVGRDLAPEAAAFLHDLRRALPGPAFSRCRRRTTASRCDTAEERRCEQLTGGVPPWTWPELGPMVRDLDALYVNFISGFEMDLATAQLLRHGFGGLLYADLHSLFLGRTRRDAGAPAAAQRRPLVRLLRRRTAERGRDAPPRRGPARGRRRALGGDARRLSSRSGPWARISYFTGRPVRTARISPPAGGALAGGDPTGCGDVFGAVRCAPAAGAPISRRPCASAPASERAT